MKDPIIAEFRTQFPDIHLLTIKTVINENESSASSGRLFKLIFLVIFVSIMVQVTQGSTVNMKFLPQITQGKELLFEHDKYKRSNPTKTRFPAISYSTGDTLKELEKVVSKDKKLAKNTTPTSKKYKVKIKLCKTREVQEETNNEIKNKSIDEEVDEAINLSDGDQKMLTTPIKEQPDDKVVSNTEEQSGDKVVLNTEDPNEPIGFIESNDDMDNRFFQETSSSLEGLSAYASLQLLTEPPAQPRNEMDEIGVEEKDKGDIDVVKDTEDEANVTNIIKNSTFLQHGEPQMQTLVQVEKNKKENTLTRIEKNEEEPIFIKMELPKVIKGKSTRTTKLSEALRSPYKERGVQLNVKRHKEEDRIADWIFAANGEI
ncbi:hypothetical protein L1987_78378 [Smallanthus sonchifolius]|uniref:Uncharacterized protein n=1 Tax=Smallanthus sonchifolius TaxID=185202 RepID=A0ACB8ZDJ8_9ASTR|nr:hypothetical protein L1987_78378 [Smallanthus sonchifolius]